MMWWCHAMTEKVFSCVVSDNTWDFTLQSKSTTTSLMTTLTTRCCVFCYGTFGETTHTFWFPLVSQHQTTSSFLSTSQPLGAIKDKSCHFHCPLKHLPLWLLLSMVSKNMLQSHSHFADVSTRIGKKNGCFNASFVVDQKVVTLITTSDVIFFVQCKFQWCLQKQNCAMHFRQNPKIDMFNILIFQISESSKIWLVLLCMILHALWDGPKFISCCKICNSAKNTLWVCLKTRKIFEIAQCNGLSIFRMHK